MNKNAPTLQPIQIKGNEAITFSSSLSEISNIETKSTKKTKKPIDFYSMFTKAILHNEDELINQKKCIDEILKGKTEEEDKKPNRAKKTSKEEKKIKSITKAQMNDLQTQIDILSVKAKKEKVFGPLSLNIDQLLQSNDNIGTNTNTNNKKTAEDEERKMKEDQKKKIKEKRRRVIQRALIFLESNSIVISDFIRKNPFQETPHELKYSFEFIEAVKFGEYELVKSALQMNHDFLFSYDYFKQTGYHWAAKLGNHKVLNLLISNGKYVNQYDYQNRTPLFLAALNNQYECCKLLLSSYGNPYLVDINNKKPVEVTTDKDIYVLINNYMDTPYSNPAIRKQMCKVVKILEQKKMTNTNSNNSNVNNGFPE